MTLDLTGQSLGPYKLTSLLHSSETGSLYVGSDESSARPLAVKVFCAAPVHDPDFFSRFTNEARHLAELDHPSILPLYDLGEMNDLPYVVMPLMAAGSLAGRLQRDSLSLSEAVRIFTPIADALDYAQSKGVIHGDLKPRNILFDGQDHPFLTDFRLPSLKGAHMPQYTSPEEVRGDLLDSRSDVYSLGAVLYQAVTGHPPFEAATPQGILFKVATQNPPPPHQLQTSLPQEVDSIIDKALAKDPKDRYATATEFVRALATAQDTTALAQERPAPAAALAPTPDLAAPHSAPVSATGVSVPPSTPQSTPSAPAPAAPAPSPKALGGGRSRWLIGSLLGIPSVMCLIGSIALLSYGIGNAASGWARLSQAPLLPSTQTTNPAAFAERTATAQAALATAKAQEQWPLVLSDSFENNRNGWRTGNNTDSLGTIRRNFAYGKYIWAITATQGVVFQDSPTMNPLSDFYATVIAHRAIGSVDASYGVIFRSKDQNYYAFVICDCPGFQFLLRDNGTWKQLISWTKTDAIKPGQENRITVSAIGSQFVFFINDQYVAGMMDSTLPDGAIGLAAGPGRPGDQAIIEFSRLEVLTPPNLEAVRATATAVSRWPILLSDSFDDNTNHWPARTLNDKYGTLVWSIRDGKYHWEAEAQKSVAWYAYAGVGPVSDMNLSAEVHLINGPKDARYGLVFRSSSAQKYYFFNIGDDQETTLSLDNNGIWSTLLERSDVAAIRPGEPNRLMANAQGSRITLFINDQEVGEVNDSTFAAGKSGLAIDLNANTEGVFEFDNFELRAP
jgi:serine/threonine protein kinase